MKPNMQPWTLFFEGTEEESLILETLLEEIALCCSRFENKENRGQTWLFEALFEDEPLKNSFVLSHIKSTPLALDRFISHPLPEKDWVAENRASFEPIDVGRFLIHPSHYVPAPDQDKICFEINASFAFGTGNHATTKGCLQLLDSLKTHTFQKILDLGCGTGLLAMAAASLFPKADVQASDNDPEAVAMTQQNLDKNSLNRRVQPILSEGFDATSLQEGPYDLILANILAKPLIILAPEIACRTTETAHVILSGLLISQEHDVIKAYQNNGFTPLKALHLDEWSAVLLKKS